jgi:hypothetical protein
MILDSFQDSLADMIDRLKSSAIGVRLSSLPQILHEFYKYPAKNPGLLYLDYFLTVNTASERRSGNGFRCMIIRLELRT